MPISTDEKETIVANLAEFNFNNLPDGWVEGIWESNFCDIEALKDDIVDEIMDAESLPHVLSNTSACCQRYVAKGSNPSFWDGLQKNNVNIRTVVAYLCALIDCGQSKTSSVETKTNALLAVDLYLSLTQINGANAFHIFSSRMFEKSMETLQSFYNCTAVKSAAPAPVANSRGRKKISDINMSCESRETAEDDAEADLERLQLATKNVLKTVWKFLGSVSLAGRSDCLSALCATLSIYLNMSTGGKSSTARANAELELSERSPSGLAFAILHRLFAGDQGDVKSLAGYAFKHLLPHLLMVSGEKSNTATVPANLVRLRDLMVNFICSLLDDHAERVAPAVYIVLQHLCVKVTDKSDYRAKVAEVVMTLAARLPPTQFQQYLKWLHRYSLSTNVTHRAFALDVAVSLFHKTMTTAQQTFDEQSAAQDLPRICCDMIFGRCSDKAASVRCRALNSVARLFDEVRGSKAQQPERAKVLISYINRENPAVSNNGDGSTGGDEAAADADHPEPTTNGESERSATNALSMLLHRCSDSKVLVRKAAVSALESLALMNPGHLNAEVVHALQNRCLDVAVSVRKQALETINNLLVNTEDRTLENAWLFSVLQSVVDRETSVQDKCLEYFSDVILHNVTATANDTSNRAWRMLDAILCEGTLTRFSKRILQQLVRRAKVPSHLNNALKAHCLQELRAKPVWFLMSELVSVLSINLDYIKKIWPMPMLEQVFSYVTNVLVYIASRSNVTDDDRQFFIIDLKQKLEAFLLPPENIAAALVALWKLESSKNANVDFRQWYQECAANCHTYLAPIVFDESGRQDLTGILPSVIRRLFTLGELCQLCPTIICKDVLLLIHAFLFSDMNNEQPDARQDLPAILRAYAVTTLGKVCLQSEECAKSSVPALVVLLESPIDFTVRNNIMVVLADLCIQYTFLVDRYIGSIAKCLNDPSPLIRKQTLTLLTNLLKEDYLKWRGSLLFRFLISLLDSDSQIRAFTEFCLTNILVQRQPTMFFLHFMECIFYFNDCRHPSWAMSSDAANDQDNIGRLSLSGEKNRARRLYLYKFMLAQFNDQQRFQMTTRICQEILGAIVDDIVPLDDNSEEIVADSFIILASREMKLLSLSSRAVAEEAEDADPQAVALADVARRAISNTVKQTALEHIVPTLMSLKIIINRRQRNGLTKLLLIYLRELMHDYKKEIQEILMADRVLASEIEYDLKQLDKGDSAAVQLPSAPPAVL